jgi:N-methylhydantoinase A
MATELTKLLAQNGADPREQVLLAYGGAGPTMANILAEEAELGAVLVPPSPGTFCALGAALADLRNDDVRPARVMLGDGGTGFARVQDLLAELRHAAQGWVAAQHRLLRSHALQASADIRYPGQAYELLVDLPASPSEAGMIAAFHAAHERIYGFREAGSPVEVMNLRLTAHGHLPPVTLPAAANLPTPSAPETRTVHLRGGLAAAVHPRATLGAGARIAGPAIVEQPDTTTLVLPGWTAEGLADGSLHLTRSAA